MGGSAITAADLNRSASSLIDIERAWFSRVEAHLEVLLADRLLVV